MRALLREQTLEFDERVGEQASCGDRVPANGLLATGLLISRVVNVKERRNGERITRNNKEASLDITDRKTCGSAIVGRRQRLGRGFCLVSLAVKLHRRR